MVLDKPDRLTIPDLTGVVLGHSKTMSTICLDGFKWRHFFGHDFLSLISFFHPLYCLKLKSHFS